MAARKKVDPIKQREKRAKIAAVGGLVLLLAVAAFEGPKMMKLMHQKPVVPPPSAAAPAGTGALPGIEGGTTAASGTTASGELADTDVPPAATDDGQLVSFDVFETKDPFRPQVTSDELTGSSDSSTPPEPTQGGESRSTTATANELPVATTPATAVPSTASEPKTIITVKPAAPTVSIAVNGTTSHVARGGTFPSGAPVFRLVSWAEGTARIGIVGGSYATGDPTLELTLEKAVTLENTTSGTRYKLVLLATP